MARKLSSVLVAMSSQKQITWSFYGLSPRELCSLLHMLLLLLALRTPHDPAGVSLARAPTLALRLLDQCLIVPLVTRGHRLQTSDL